MSWEEDGRPVGRVQCAGQLIEEWEGFRRCPVVRGVNARAEHLLRISIDSSNDFHPIMEWMTFIFIKLSGPNLSFSTHSTSMT